MDKITKSLHILADSVWSMIQKAISKAPYDKTQNAVVKNYNAVNNTISVDINDVTMDNTPYIGGIPNIGDIVKLTFPTNNANMRYALTNGGGGSSNSKTDNSAIGHYGNFPMQLYRTFRPQALHGGATATAYSLQSAVYNPDKNVIAMGFQSNTDDGLLVELNADTFTVIQRVTISGGHHMNDITYNPYTKKYVIATIMGYSQVLMINSNDLSIDKVIPINTSVQDAITQISYNPVTNRYIATGYTTNTSYLLDADFNILSQTKIVDWKLIENTITPETDKHKAQRLVTQGSCIYNNSFYSISSYYPYYSYVALGYDRIAQIDTSTGKVYYADYPAPRIGYEGEALYVKDNKIYSVGYTSSDLFIQELDAGSIGTEVQAFTCRHNIPNITLYVDITQTNNGNGYTQDSPLNNFTDALYLLRVNSVNTIILLSDVTGFDTSYAITDLPYFNLKGTQKSDGTYTGFKRSRLYLGNGNGVNISNVVFDDSTLQVEEGNHVHCSSNVTFQNCNNTHKTAVTGRYGSTIVLSNCVFNNNNTVVNAGSNVTMGGCTGSGNGTLISNWGGFILVSDTKPTATTLISRGSMGLTVIGSQLLQTTSK